MHHNKQTTSVRRLESFGRVRGLVVGAFAEVSADMRWLVQKIVESGAHQWAQKGMAPDEATARQILARQYRSIIGIEAARSYAQMILDNVATISGSDNPRSAARTNRDAQANYDQWLAQHALHPRGLGFDIGA